MPRSRLLACLFVLAAAVVAGSSVTNATVAPPLAVEILGEPRPAEAGSSYSGTFRLTAGAPVTLSNFLLARSAGWEPISLEAPERLALGTGETYDIPFTAMCLDPTQAPLKLTIGTDTRTADFLFDLSAETLEQGRIEQPLTLLAETSGRSAVPGLPSPAPVAVPAGAPAPAPAPGDATAKSGRSIRVHGRFKYLRYGAKYLPVDGATVHITDGGSGSFNTLTDADGFFDYTFNWVPCLSCGTKANPNIKACFISSNDRVAVHSGSSGSNLITWTTATYDQYPGSDLDIGVVVPAVSSQQRHAHALTTITRAWRWLLTQTGIDVSKVNVTCEIPDDPNNAFYNYAGTRLYLGAERTWNEGTLIHEYGHHFVSHYAAGQGTDYCNGVCDENGCNHCAWCWESEVDTWNEGLPSWIADEVTKAYPATYGHAALMPLSFEHLQPCSPGGTTIDDPNLTEGPFCAALEDIEDSAQDDDPMTTGGVDALALGTDEILTVALHDLPQTPMQFLLAFKARYPQFAQALWLTAMNDGFDLDTGKPGAPQLLWSTDHAINVPSADATLTFAWAGAPDDCSGIAAYSLSVSASGPELPLPIVTVNNVVSYSTFPLPAGTYWFNVRAVDNDGKWSDEYASSGPYVVVTPLTADVTAQTAPMWAGPVVPRPDQSATPRGVPSPASLIGGGQTWWNFSFYNTGTSETTTDIRCDLLVDGVVMDSLTVPASTPIPAGGSYLILNRGPITVPGGRHTFAARADGAEIIPERNEDDNAWARQWIWSPPALTEGTRVVRPAPPSRTGGGDALPERTGYNLDGLRVSACDGFHAVWAHALEARDDYDLQLHAASTGADSGFASFTAQSLRAPGYLDAVLFVTVPPNPCLRDVGLVNESGGASSCAVEMVPATTLAFGGTVAPTLGQDEMLRLFDVAVASGQTGPTTLALQLPAEGAGTPLHLVYFDSAFTAGNLESAARGATTDSTGFARLMCTLAAPGTCHLAVYRDPRDGTAPVSFTLSAGPTPPDLAANQPGGWYAPVVPRPAPDGAPNLVAAPESLPGDAASTWVNMALANGSPAPAPAFGSELSLDGAPVAAQAWDPLAAHARAVLNSQGPLAVRAGRHTLGWSIDPAQSVGELSEANNKTGAQWVWTPAVLAPAVPVTRVAPPDRLGGWADVAAPLATAPWFNCDGLRLAGTSLPDTRVGTWQAVAVMPGAASDVDVRLHEASAGAEDGFAAALAHSAWPRGESDFVLVNFNRTASRQLDAGTIGTWGSDPYAAEVVASSYLGANPRSPAGPFALPAGRIVNLHEVWLDQGRWSIHLENLDGQIDYGITLHPSDQAYQAKSSRVQDAIAWRAPAGQDEGIVIHVDAGGYYCLSVWKRGAADLPSAGSYRLTFIAGGTAVPGTETPAGVTLLAAQPNPFNPRTTLSFAVDAARGVTLDIFDLQGRRVRGLFAGRIAAGRHEVVWDGRDDNGRSAASGVYVARLRTDDGIRRETRVTMLK